jgi:hypothetical protein
MGTTEHGQIVQQGVGQESVEGSKQCGFRTPWTSRIIRILDYQTQYPNMSVSNGQRGLQEMTSDISKLVNLKVLNLSWNTAVNSIPESISCLQRLEELCIEYCPIQELPISFTTLANLTNLLVTGCASLRFPLDLQVTDMIQCRPLAILFSQSHSTALCFKLQEKQIIIFLLQGALLVCG